MKTRPQYAAVLLAGWLAACALPVPKTRDVAKAGKITTKRPRLDGIRAGVTTVDELRHVLDPFATDASAAEFFWARWEEAMLPYEWQGGSGSERDWRIVNVLARFDSAGLTADYRVCTERKLVECLVSFAGRVTPPTFADPPVEFNARRLAKGWGTDRFDGTMSLGSSEVSFRGHAGNALRQSAPFRFQVPWADIARVQVRYGSRAEMLWLRLSFVREFEHVDFVEFSASPAVAWSIVGAWSAAHSSTRNSPGANRRQHDRQR